MPQSCAGESVSFHFGRSKLAQTHRCVSDEVRYSLSGYIASLEPLNKVGSLFEAAGLGRTKVTRNSGGEILQGETLGNMGLRKSFSILDT